MNNTESTENTERLVNLAEIARYAGATTYSTQKALDALGYQSVKTMYNRKSNFYPESAKEPVKQWLKDN